MPQYEVTISSLIPSEGYIIVNASSKKEAEEEALASLDEIDEWHPLDGPDYDNSVVMFVDLVSEEED